MIHLKQICAACVLFLFSIRGAVATPVAVSQIEADLSTAIVSFTYDNGTGSSIPVQSLSSYSDLHVEDNGNDIQTPHLDGDGNISATAAGAVANAQSYNGNEASLNIAKATGDQGLTYAHSLTSTYLSFSVENVSSITMSLDVIASLDLSTQTPEDDAYASWKEELFLWERDPDNNLVEFPLFSYPFAFSDREVYSGANYSSGNTLVNLPLSYNFDLFGSPFTGELVIQSIATAHAEAFVAPQASVPEPSMMSFIVMGLAVLGCTRRFRKVKSE